MSIGDGFMGPDSAGDGSDGTGDSTASSNATSPLRILFPSAGHANVVDTPTSTHYGTGLDHIPFTYSLTPAATIRTIARDV